MGLTALDRVLFVSVIKKGLVNTDVTLNEIKESDDYSIKREIGSGPLYGIEFDRHTSSDTFISCQNSDGTLVKGEVVSNSHSPNSNSPSLETQFAQRSKLVTSKILQTTAIGQNNTVNFHCTVEQGDDKVKDIHFWVIKIYWFTTTSPLK